MKKRILSISIVALFAITLAGCGGGTVGSDRAGSSDGGGYDRSITVPVSGQVSDENTGEPVEGLPVYSSTDDQSEEEINSEIVFTDRDGKFEFAAKTDSNLDLKLNFDQASFVLEDMPEDSAHLRLRVAYKNDNKQSTATPTEIEIELREPEQKDKPKQKDKAPTESDLDAALESNNSSSGNGGSNRPSRAPGNDSSQTDQVIDEIDLITDMQD